MCGAVRILHQEGPVHEAFLSKMVSSYNFSMALRLLVIACLLLNVVHAQDIEGGGGEGGGGGGGGGGGEGRNMI